MAKSKFNGYAKWVIIVIVLGTIVYNGIAARVIVKNEIKHLAEDVREIKKLLLEHIVEK